MDKAVAIARDLSGISVTDNLSPLEFIHMRPKLQGWPSAPLDWTKTVMSVMNSKGELTVGNIKQSRVFHYIEKNFVDDAMLKKLEAAYV